MQANNHAHHLAPMPTQVLRMEQIKYETEVLKRLLFFMMEETIGMKNRLAEILKQSSTTDLLERLEYFQSHFISTDKCIDLMRHDLAELETLHELASYGDEKALRDAPIKLKTCRNSLSNTGKDFAKLVLDFNHYLLEHV